MSVGGKVYLATGDISPTSLLTSSCLVFNKKLFSDNDMEYPYEMAANGTWTIDKLVEMTKGLTRDVNGDGKYTLNDDIFGFSSWMCDSPYSLFYGAGGTLSEKDAEDIPYASFDIENISDIYGKMYQLIVEQESYFVTSSAEYETTYECFSNGGAYFCEITLQKIDMSAAPEKRYDDNVSCLLRRQCQPNFDASCQLRFAPGADESAGLMMMQQCNHQLRVEKRAGEIRVVLAECKMDCPPFLPMFVDTTVETVLTAAPCYAEEVTLRIVAKGQDVSVYNNDVLLCHVDGRRINPEELGPMTGTMIGMFAATDGVEADNWATFDWFRYKEEVK